MKKRKVKSKDTEKCFYELYRDYGDIEGERFYQNILSLQGMSDIIVSGNYFAPHPFSDGTFKVGYSQNIDDECWITIRGSDDCNLRRRVSSVEEARRFMKCLPVFLDREWLANWGDWDVI